MKGFNIVPEKTYPLFNKYLELLNLKEVSTIE